ncbi:hypothetical protein EDB81DRAFT_887945 [Dactylonectria macrodidyma]|uniref:JmjC domain-containing protein n=1 Tax=Dactylonectria macrodidyma TaxID=307937 RepID=A0A9P9E838_9HYPO|nr:hypothetical protein EDB81DRAFT_887945 [Dactylonectria macrodidyma]
MKDKRSAVASSQLKQGKNTGKRKRKGKGNTAITHGERNNMEVIAHLKESSPPNTNPSRGKVEAHFCTTAEAKALAGSTITVPIIAQGQQTFQWSNSTRPIEQLFETWLENHDHQVPVQKPSLLESGDSFQYHTLAEVYEKFKVQTSDDDPWNVLDMTNSLPPTTFPSFLEHANCHLLSRIQDEVLSGGLAQRKEVRVKEAKYWKDVISWILLSQGGNNTSTHTDGHGFGTWISVQEGLVIVYWISNPTDEEWNAWSRDHTCNSGRGRFVVLKPGQTICFPPGTIHLVCRSLGAQTFAVGGHFMQWSDIMQSLRTMKRQQINPHATNDEMTKESILALTMSILKLVKKRIERGKVDDIGGIEEANAIVAAIEDWPTWSPR